MLGERARSQEARLGERRDSHRGMSSLRRSAYVQEAEGDRVTEPHYCAIAGKYCYCETPCNVEDDDYERATYCGCDKGAITQQERETRKCQRCGKRI